MAKITNVRKTVDGDICEVRLDNGQSMKLQDAVKLANQGGIVGTDRAGNPYLHSKRGQDNYKLSELPEF